MKSTWSAALLLALAGLGCGSAVSVGLGGAAGGVGVGFGAPSTSPQTEIRSLADRINRHRESLGCSQLVWDDHLATVARRHSEDMTKRHFFSHTNPDGKNPFDRLKDAKVTYRAAAENLAQGQTLGRDVYDDWIESQGHRENLENCEYTHFGIGWSNRNWTLLLVRH